MSKDNVNETFVVFVISVHLPQADQKGKQNLLQVKLKKEYTYLVGVAKNLS